MLLRAKAQFNSHYINPAINDRAKHSQIYTISDAKHVLAETTFSLAFPLCSPGKCLTPTPVYDTCLVIPDEMIEDSVLHFAEALFPERLFSAKEKPSAFSFLYLQRIYYLIFYMKSQIEINRLAVHIDSRVVNTHQKAIILSEGQLPVVDATYKLGLVNVNWDVLSEYKLPEKYNLTLAGELLSPDWKIVAKPDVFARIKWQDRIVQWGEDFPFKLEQLRIGETSRFYVDNHEVNLTNSITKILNHLTLSANRLCYIQINKQLRVLSGKFFGSSLITDLFNNLYYSIGGEFRVNSGEIRLSASYDRNHFTQTNDVPPYIFLSMPTPDLMYFVNQRKFPNLEVKGYKISIQSIEVIGDNHLNIKLKELSKNWDISVDTSFKVRDNTIFPEVDHIEAKGLDLLTKALFRVFKGLLIRQIENRPIEVREAYQKGKRNFESRYPFLTLNPDHHPVADTLLIGKEKTEVMVHFMEEEVNI